MRTPSVTALLWMTVSLSTAWPWPPSLDGLMAVSHLENLLFQRQGDSKSKDAVSSQSVSKTSAESSSETTSLTSATPASSGATSATPPKTGSRQTSGTSVAQKTDSSSQPSKTTLAPISPNDPAGAVAMISPAITSGAQYYAIGEWVTFAWNYTYLLRDPTAINVLASLSQSNNGVGSGNTATYTLTQNMTYQATPTILWDTDKWATSATPLAPGMYTLIIYDADATGGMTAAPSAGYLGLYNQFSFGMYTPAAYTALAPMYQCATCNSALSSMEKMTLSFLFGMATLTVVSFTWFASGSGILF